MKKGLLSIVGIIVILIIIYFCYWIFKTVSYKLFYEDMVEETITEMIKSDCLKVKP